MLQTNSSGPSLGALSLDMPPKVSVTRSDNSDGGFTQEYDKQVKNIESSKKERAASESESASAESRVGRKATATERVPANNGGKAATDDASEHVVPKAASEEQQGGNILPLEQMRIMAAKAPLQLESPEERDITGIALPEEVVGLLDDKLSADAASLVALINQPVPELVKVTTGQSLAPVVTAATIQGVEADSEILDVTAEMGTELDEQSALLLKERGKEGDFSSLLLRQPNLPKEGGAERGVESLLNLSGRPNTAAASIDTINPTLVPLAGQGASSPLATPAPVAMTLAMPMSQANWGSAVAERVMWMSNANIQEAELQLHPRELGPIGIKITVHNEQTHVSFVAQHATTREALEAALPRLREMLSENGLQPGNTDVSQHSFKGREGQADGGTGRGGRADGVQEVDEHLLGAEMTRGVGYATPSGVDAFA